MLLILKLIGNFSTLSIEFKLKTTNHNAFNSFWVTNQLNEYYITEITNLIIESHRRALKGNQSPARFLIPTLFERCVPLYE